MGMDFNEVNSSDRDMKQKFNDLLLKSMQLNTVLGSNDGPQLVRGFDQIGNQSSKLVRKTARGDSGSVKASALLASKGFDLEKSQQELDSINMKATFEPLDPLADTDVDGYLRHEHEIMVLTSIEESKKHTISEFYESHISSIQNDWEQEKLEILNAFAKRGATLDASVFDGSYSEASSKKIQQTLNGRQRSLMTTDMLNYAVVVSTLAEHQLKGEPFALISYFIECCKSSDDHRKTELTGLWQLLSFMLRESFFHEGKIQAGILSKGHYFKEYNSGDSPSSQKLNTLFIEGSKSFLELKYMEFVKSLVVQNANRAMLGGVPGTLSYIRAF
eukprot:Sdes_comp11788_c0_seq1m2852